MIDKKLRVEYIRVQTDLQTKKLFKRYCQDNDLSMSNELYLAMIKIMENKK